jgi:hypothetical protein
LRRDPKTGSSKGMDTFFGGIEIRGSLCLLLSKMHIPEKGCEGHPTVFQFPVFLFCLSQHSPG